MTRTRYLALPLMAALVTLLSLMVGAQRVHGSPATRRAAAPTSPHHYLAAAGYGQDDWATNVYAPRTLNVYVGDTVTWTNRGRLEPHTITFGPMPMLRQLAKNTVLVKPQPSGPPTIELNPAVGLPSRGTRYNGAGYANSGFLTSGKSWSITFTRPGTYHYYCLIHFPGMQGTVIVHQRPAASTRYYVHVGNKALVNANDAFFPENLTVHVGNSVVFYGAQFHTVTFAPMSVINGLRRKFIVPVPQKAGPPLLTMNPQVAFPVGGTTVSGMGMVSSGLLQPPHTSFTVTFTKPGIYTYGCLIHPGMDGSIRVLP